MRNKLTVTVLLIVLLKCNGQMPDKAFLDQLLYSQGIDPNDVIVSSVDGDYSHTTTQTRPWQQKPQVVANTEPETIIVVVEEDQLTNQQYGPPTYNYNTNYRPGFQNKPPNHQHRPGYNNQHGNNHHHHHHHHHYKPGYNNQHGSHGNGNNRPHGHYGNPNYQNSNHGHYNQYPNTGNNEQDNADEPILGNPIPGNVITTSTNSPISDKSTTANNMQTTAKPSNKPILVPLNPDQYVYQGDKIDIKVPSKKPDENKTPEEENEEDAPIDIRFGD